MATSRPSRFPRVPYGGIRWLVGRMHVGLSTVDVAADIAHRLNAAGARPAEICEAVRYALACHEENRSLYRAVTSGRLS